MIPICETNQVDDPGCHEFSFRAGAGNLAGFVVHWQGRWYAYRNSCPHTGVSLNWQPQQFFDYSQQLLQCALHGALFEPDTGLCIHGPCLGRHLQPLCIVQRGSVIYLNTEGLPVADQG